MPQYFDPIPQGASNSPETVNTPLTALDNAIASLRASYTAPGAAISTLTNGATSGGATLINVDSAAGFLPGNRVAYVTVAGTMEYNYLVTVSPTQVQVQNAVGGGGILNDSVFSRVSESEYRAATAVNHTVTPMLEDAIRWVSQNTFNVRAYGAYPGNTETANKAAIQAAIDDAGSVNGYVVFPADGGQYIIEGELEIGASVHIIGNGAKITGVSDAGSLTTTSAIFALVADVEFLTIRDIQADWSGLTNGATHGKEFFTNGSTDGRNQTGVYSASAFEYGKLMIDNCTLNNLKISIYTTPDGFPTVQNCRWKMISTNARAAPHYLMIGGDTGVSVLNNHFDVYCPSGLNQDIVKIYAGDTTHALVDGNHFQNRNTASEAQLDMYDGGNRAKIVNNRFINAMLMRKQVGSGPHITVINFDQISNNYFHKDTGYTYPTEFIHFNGSFGQILNNQFYNAKTPADVVCINLVQHEQTSPETDAALNSQWPLVVDISHNICRGALYFIQSNATLDTIRTASYSWTASGAGTNEYYLRTSGGANPNFPEPDVVTENSVFLPKRTRGSLTAGSWGWGDGDTLGYSTIYVRLSDDTDPDGKATDYVKKADPTGRMVLMGNIVWDTPYMVRVFNNTAWPAWTTAIGNIIKSDSSVTESLGHHSVSVGNLALNANHIIQGNAVANVAGSQRYGVAQAVLDAANGNFYWLTSATALTTIVNGRIGQMITIKCNNGGGCTINHNTAAIRLTAGANLSLSNHQAVQLICDTGTVWVQV